MNEWRCEDEFARRADGGARRQSRCDIIITLTLVGSSPCRGDPLRQELDDEWLSDLERMEKQQKAVARVQSSVGEDRLYRDLIPQGLEI